jgi:dolichol-phosphate mannosyltransferase
MVRHHDPLFHWTQTMTTSTQRHDVTTGAAQGAGPELAIVIPTFCEIGNLEELVNRIESTLSGTRVEIVFVDDNSPDGTAGLARSLAQDDARVRCIQRIGRRGLSSAVIEGILATSAPFIAVMDADMQHDESLLPSMLDALRNSHYDVVVGSRYVSGGGLGDWNSRRAGISRFATRLSRTVLKAELSDPMSGFFAIRRDVFMDAVENLSAIGFKILLDIFASSPSPLRFLELPYTFRQRKLGESKLDNQAAWDYVMLLLDKLVGHIVPVRFVAFAFVGGLGLIVHLVVLSILYKGMAAPFVASQATATFVAMAFNFTLNNELTYRDLRLRGWAWLRGWLSFTLACSVGALANVGIASYLFGLDTIWIVAAIAGVLVGVVWNYAVTMIYTWRRRPAQA